MSSMYCMSGFPDHDLALKAKKFGSVAFSGCATNSASSEFFPEITVSVG